MTWGMAFLIENSTIVNGVHPFRTRALEQRFCDVQKGRLQQICVQHSAVQHSDQVSSLRLSFFFGYRTSCVWEHPSGAWIHGSQGQGHQVTLKKDKSRASIRFLDELTMFSFAVLRLLEHIRKSFYLPGIQQQWLQSATVPSMNTK